MGESLIFDALFRMAASETQRRRGRDGCEWDPGESRPAFEDDTHYRTVPAEVLVGANGDWRLCLACSELPEFRRYRIKKPIAVRAPHA